MRRKLASNMGILQREIAERQHAEMTLRESERRLLTYIEQAPIAIFVANADAELIDANPAACRMTGYSREELLRLGIRGISQSIGDDVEMSLFESLMANGIVSGETRLIKKDGSELWVQLDAVTLGPNRLVSFCADITRRKQTEESLRHQQRMESLGTMAGGVAHEINNPLMGMMSYAELIEGRIEDPDAVDYARNILLEGERIAHIVRNLLAFAREDRGVRQPADLRSIVRDALPLINTALLRSQITVHTELDTPVPDIHCSRPQIQQVLVNLLMNARDALDLKHPGFDPSKTMTIRVEPHRKNNETWIRVVIHDRGVGMSDDLTSLAFDPFFTTKSRDERTGLGLTVSFGIIREHGGTIEIHSVEGEGTSVIIDFPPAAAEETP